MRALYIAAMCLVFPFVLLRTKFFRSILTLLGFAILFLYFQTAAAAGKHQIETFSPLVFTHEPMGTDAELTLNIRGKDFLNASEGFDKESYCRFSVPSQNPNESVFTMQPGVFTPERENRSRSYITFAANGISRKIDIVCFDEHGSPSTDPNLIQKILKESPALAFRPGKEADPMRLPAAVGPESTGRTE